MQNSSSIREELPNEDYNSIPVTYCKNCLSLKILILEDNIDYCDDCGCTETCTTDIASWENMYEEKYGKPFNTK